MMNAKERIVSFLDKQGFYIVLALCFVVISVTAVLSLRKGNELSNEQAQTPTFEEQGKEANYAGENMVLEDVTDESTTKTQGSQGGQSKLSISRPVQGDVIMEYAKDKLLYNSTLKQWTTHEGIDIACEEGSAVKAVLGGTIEEVSEDALMGTTITITHENGYKSVYSNLAKEVSVAKGDKVEKEQQIGTAGKTAISEFDAEPHLHFELYSGENSVNPMEYMSGIKVK